MWAPVGQRASLKAARNSGSQASDNEGREFITRLTVGTAQQGNLQNAISALVGQSAFYVCRSQRASSHLETYSLELSSFRSPFPLQIPTPSVGRAASEGGEEGQGEVNHSLSQRGRGPPTTAPNWRTGSLCLATKSFLIYWIEHFKLWKQDN